MEADAPESSENDWIRRFLDGDERAFDALVRAHQDRIYRLVLALLGEPEDARDAAQEVFLRAFRGLHGWRYEARLATWLYGVAVNVCREARRRRASERIKRKRWALLVAPFLARRGQAVGSGAASRLVDLLPPRQREVVVLRVFQELTIEETATVLGIPEGTVKSNFAKAVASLRARLQERERAVEAECR